MNSRTTLSFWKAFYALPPKIQQRAKKAYQLWRENPDLPGLRFKRVGNKVSVRVTPVSPFPVPRFPLPQRLRQVRNQVIWVFQANRDAQEMPS